MRLFLLGLASGCTLLVMTAYGRISPRWLKQLLLLTGLLMIGRNFGLALYDTSASLPTWLLRTSPILAIGLTLPAVMVIDQLLRHPGMSPQQLLTWYAPFAVGFATAPFISWHPILVRAILGVFILGYFVSCLAVMLKTPSLPIRIALLGLTVAYACLGIAILPGNNDVLPCAVPLVLVALWFAYDTAERLQVNR